MMSKTWRPQLRALTINFEEALSHVENSLDDMRKYIGCRVVKQFFDEDVGHDRDYAGHVQSVDFNVADGCFLFHVSYDSDSDDEDMEHWELKKYIRDV